MKIVLVKLKKSLIAIFLLLISSSVYAICVAGVNFGNESNASRGPTITGLPLPNEPHHAANMHYVSRLARIDSLINKTFLVNNSLKSYNDFNPLSKGEDFYRPGIFFRNNSDYDVFLAVTNLQQKNANDLPKYSSGSINQTKAFYLRTYFVERFPVGIFNNRGIQMLYEIPAYDGNTQAFNQNQQGAVWYRFRESDFIGWSPWLRIDKKEIEGQYLQISDVGSSAPIINNNRFVIRGNNIEHIYENQSLEFGNNLLNQKYDGIKRLEFNKANIILDMVSNDASAQFSSSTGNLALEAVGDNLVRFVTARVLKEIDKIVFSQQGLKFQNNQIVHQHFSLASAKNLTSFQHNVLSNIGTLLVGNLLINSEIVGTTNNATLNISKTPGNNSKVIFDSATQKLANLNTVHSSKLIVNSGEILTNNQNTISFSNYVSPQTTLQGAKPIYENYTTFANKYEVTINGTASFLNNSLVIWDSDVISPAKELSFNANRVEFRNNPTANTYHKISDLASLTNRNVVFSSSKPHISTAGSKTTLTFNANVINFNNNNLNFSGGIKGVKKLIVNTISSDASTNISFQATKLVFTQLATKANQLTVDQVLINHDGITTRSATDLTFNASYTDFSSNTAVFNNSLKLANDIKFDTSSGSNIINFTNNASFITPTNFEKELIINQLKTINQPKSIEFASNTIATDDDLKLTSASTITFNGTVQLTDGGCIKVGLNATPDGVVFGNDSLGYGTCDNNSKLELKISSPIQLTETQQIVNLAKADSANDAISLQNIYDYKLHQYKHKDDLIFTQSPTTEYYLTENRLTSIKNIQNQGANRLATLSDLDQFKETYKNQYNVRYGVARLEHALVNTYATNVKFYNYTDFKTMYKVFYNDCRGDLWDVETRDPSCDRSNRLKNGTQISILRFNRNLGNITRDLQFLVFVDAAVTVEPRYDNFNPDNGSAMTASLLMTFEGVNHSNAIDQLTYDNREYPRMIDQISADYNITKVKKYPRRSYYDSASAGIGCSRDIKRWLDCSSESYIHDSPEASPFYYKHSQKQYYSKDPVGSTGEMRYYLHTFNFNFSKRIAMGLNNFSVIRLYASYQNQANSTRNLFLKNNGSYYFGRIQDVMSEEPAYNTTPAIAVTGNLTIVCLNCP